MKRPMKQSRLSSCQKFAALRKFADVEAGVFFSKKLFSIAQIRTKIDMLKWDDDRKKHDVFNGETTYLNDFPNPGWVERKLYKWPSDRSEPAAEEPKKIAGHDNETMAEWREGSHVPFDLLWEPKPIIRTIPSTPFKIPDIPEDAGKENAIKTRPRVYMSPAISLDDVEDRETRQMIVRQMYKTDMRRAMEEVVRPVTKREVYNSITEKNRESSSVKKDLNVPIDGKLRAKAKEWDLEQMRALVDPTRTFWLEKDPPVICGACTNPYKGLVPNEVKQEIADLVAEDKLRMAHDIPYPSYAGYRPRLSAGVSLRKVEMPITHPSLSNTQTLDLRREGRR